MSASASTTIASTFEVLLQPILREAKLTTIREKYWRDLDWCEQHDCMCEGAKLFPQADYNPVCQNCPLNPVARGRFFQLEIPPAIMARFKTEGPQPAEDLRAHWKALYEKLKEAELSEQVTNETGNAGRGRNTMHSAGRKAAAIQERDAWLQYCHCCHLLRTPLMKPAVERRTTAFYPRYAALLQNFTLDAMMRNRSSGQIVRVWCLKHAKEAHFVPVNGGVDCIKSYDRTCGLCPLKVDFAPPKRRAATSSANLEAAVNAAIANQESKMEDV